MAINGFAAEGPARPAWIGGLAALTVGGSLVFACAAPFAGLAALAVLTLKRRDAFVATLLAWLANQAIGYGLLNYPQNANSFGWGLAIGVGALVGTGAAGLVKDRLRAPWPVVALATFAAAFVTYQLSLYAATAFLASSASAFGLEVILYVLQVNAMGFAGLLLAAMAVRGLGLATQRAG